MSDHCFLYYFILHLLLLKPAFVSNWGYANHTLYEKSEYKNKYSRNEIIYCRISVVIRSSQWKNSGSNIYKKQDCGLLKWFLDGSPSLYCIVFCLYNPLSALCHTRLRQLLLLWAISCLHFVQFWSPGPTILFIGKISILKNIFIFCSPQWVSARNADYKWSK